MTVADRPSDVRTRGAREIGACLDVRIRVTPALAMVRLAGELDLSSVHLLNDAVAAISVAAPAAPTVLVDLAGVTFCDVTGLRGLQDAAAHTERVGKQLVLYGTPACVTRLVAVTGVARELSSR